MIEFNLAPGEQLRVDTGCIVSMAETVDYDIQFVGGFRNALFGGEGLFYATLTGPGHVVLQTLPFSRLANRLMAAAGGHRDESKGLGGTCGGCAREHHFGRLSVQGDGSRGDAEDAEKQAPRLRSHSA